MKKQKHIETRGRKSQYINKRIYKAVKDNPRRKGTPGHKSFSIIRNGMTYDQYKRAGGRPQDLQWDVNHGYVKVKR